MRRPLLALLLLATAARADDAKPKESAPEQALVEALSAEKAFQKGEAKLVRAATAKFFEQTHADDIAAAYGDHAEKLNAWLAANPDIREAFYAGIDPAVDQVGPALTVFRELWKLDAAKLKDYPNVGIALALTWDSKKGVYDYSPHARRTKSDVAGGMKAFGYKENFAYLTGIEGPLKQAVQFFPWEFLVHVVNHQTPTDERDWARKNYLTRRAGVGKTYFDVEYDQEMLKTNSEICKLNGKPYTLQSIKRNGGVCAMQADFAARVAKSLVVPAEYVWGESNSGGMHAWVMWVEVKSVTKEKIEFSLMSEGRYLGDQFYVGKVIDPRTGGVTTDRDMERRLTFLGFAPQNARHAALLMRAYPVIRDKKQLSVKGQADYLRRVHELFPSDEQAWLALAELYKSGQLKDPAAAYAACDKALKTFANFPDFSWRLVDALLTPKKEVADKARLFELVVAGYERLNRPDLACEARVKLADYQVEAKEFKKAADGLANTMRKFPAEGRYVPKMMTKLQEICAQFPASATKKNDGVELLGKFYLEFLPKVPARRGDDVSKYCVAMHEQAATFFEGAGKPKEAELVRQNLQLVKQGRVK